MKRHAHVDLVTVGTAGLSAVLVIATLKLVALKYHAHPLGQAVLTVL